VTDIDADEDMNAAFAVWGRVERRALRPEGGQRVVLPLARPERGRAPYETVLGDRRHRRRVHHARDRRGRPPNEGE